MQEFGKALSGARRRKKWSQRKLAQASGLSRSYINDIEHGRSAGTVATWVSLARALGLSLDDLFLGRAATPDGMLFCGESRCPYRLSPTGEQVPARRLKKRT